MILRLESMSAPHWSLSRLLVFLVWVIYLPIVLAPLAYDDPLRPMYPFWFCTLVGLMAGVSALRGSKRWPVWVSIAALLYLLMSSLRHAHFVLGVLSYKPTLSAALDQYLLVDALIMRKYIEAEAFPSLLIHLYYEWLMPVLQVAILVFAVRAWWHMRSNPAVNLAPFGRWTLRDKAAQRRLP